MEELQLVDVMTRFAAANSSWLTTVRRDGRPHTAPVWHVWSGGHIYVVTTPTAVKVANICSNPHVALSHPDPHEVIIIDGRAAVVHGVAEQLRPFFQAKYEWDIVADEEYSVVIAIEPMKVLAWPEEGAGFRQRWLRADLEELG